MLKTLKNHPVWDSIETILAQIDSKAVALEHIELMGYKICGYWGENTYYEEIRFTVPLQMELIRSSLSVVLQGSDIGRTITFEFSLKAGLNNSEMTVGERDMVIGEMTLVLNEQLEFIDERWVVNVTSPYVTAIKGLYDG